MSEEKFDTIVIDPIRLENGDLIKIRIEGKEHFLFEIQFSKERMIQRWIMNDNEMLSDEEFIESIKKADLKDLDPQEIERKTEEEVNLLRERIASGVPSK